MWVVGLHHVDDMASKLELFKGIKHSEGVKKMFSGVFQWTGVELFCPAGHWNLVEIHIF